LNVLVTSPAMNAGTLHREKPETVCGSRITGKPSVLSKSQIIDGIKAFDVKELPALEPGAFVLVPNWADGTTLVKDAH
jgi:hypothetical protein